MAFCALGVPDLDGLVEVGERERDRGDHRHQAVRREELAPVEGGARERAHAIGRPRALRPVPGGDGREAPGSDTTAGGVALPVGTEPLAPVIFGLGAEDEREELDGLETQSEVGELRRKLAGDLGCDGGPLVGSVQEHQRPCELVGRPATQGRLAGELVRAA